MILTSCIKEVDLKTNNLPNKVVINGFINPDSTFKVRVTLSSSMHENKEIITNAIVKMYENGNYLFDLTHFGNGWYQVWVKPEEGKHYRVEVTVPNYEMVYATTSIPVFPTIVSSKYEKMEKNQYLDWSYNAMTTINFQDDPSIKNYYQPGVNHYRYEQTKEIDESILTESDLDYQPTHYYFSDLLFNGQQKQLKIMTGGMITENNFGGFYYQNDYTFPFSIVSEEYFNSIKRWTVHSFNQSSDNHLDDPISLLFLGDPIEMYSNVIGGYGVFAGYNKKLISVPAHE